MIPKRVSYVLERVLESAGETAASLRKAVFARAEAASGLRKSDEALPAALEPYVEKVAERPATVEERDLQALRDAGYSDEQIFELTIAAAMGASLFRFGHGLALVRGEDVDYAVRG